MIAVPGIIAVLGLAVGGGLGYLARARRWLRICALLVLALTPVAVVALAWDAGTSGAEDAPNPLGVLYLGMLVWAPILFGYVAARLIGSFATGTDVGK